jgi:hypothetical protein
MTFEYLGGENEHIIAILKDNQDSKQGKKTNNYHFKLK